MIPKHQGFLAASLKTRVLLSSNFSLGRNATKSPLHLFETLERLVEGTKTLLMRSLLSSDLCNFLFFKRDTFNLTNEPPFLLTIKKTRELPTAPATCITIVTNVWVRALFVRLQFSSMYHLLYAYFVLQQVQYYRSSTCRC